MPDKFPTRGIVHVDPIDVLKIAEHQNGSIKGSLSQKTPFLGTITVSFKQLAEMLKKQEETGDEYLWVKADYINFD